MHAVDLISRPDVTPCKNALSGASVRKSAKGKSSPKRPITTCIIIAMVSGTGSAVPAAGGIERKSDGLAVV